MGESSRVRPLAAGVLLTVLLLSPALGTAGATAASEPFSVGLGTVPRGVAVDPTSGVVYALLYLNGTTVALEPSTFQVFGIVSTPSPYAIADDPATGDVYVSGGQGSPSVSVLDSSANSVVATVKGAGTPYALAVDDPDGLLFAADTSSESLYAIRTSTDVVAARLPVGATSALAVDPNTHEVFIGNLSSRSDAVVAYSAQTLKVVGTVSIPFPPEHVAVDPSTGLVFVASGGEQGSSAVNFLAMNETTMQVAYGIRLGQAPGVVVVASSPDVYVSDAGQNRLYELDGSTGRVLLNSTGDPSDDVDYTGITAMAFDPVSGNLYITEQGVTGLVVLATGIPVAASSGSELTYAYLGVAATAVVVGALYVMLRRQPRAAPDAGRRASGLARAKTPALQG